jgi:hypothetical protein
MPCHLDMHGLSLNYLVPSSCDALHCNSRYVMLLWRFLCASTTQRTGMFSSYLGVIASLCALASNWSQCGLPLDYTRPHSQSHIFSFSSLIYKIQLTSPTNQSRSPLCLPSVILYSPSQKLTSQLSGSQARAALHKAPILCCSPAWLLSIHVLMGSQFTQRRFSLQAVSFKQAFDVLLPEAAGQSFRFADVHRVVRWCYGQPAQSFCRPGVSQNSLHIFAWSLS